MLRVEHLHFGYRKGGEELFGGLTHQFLPGAVTAVTGASGCGKSTLLYLLGLLLRPRGGGVVVDGRDVARLTDEERSAVRARRMGFVFQDAALDSSRTLVDAVIEPALYAGLTARDARPQAMRLLSQFALEHRAGHRPGQISGGQAQRVALCRALVVDPVIILADEPTGNLDRENSAIVLGTLADAASQGRTVVIATHDPYVIDHADDVLGL